MGKAADMQKELEQNDNISADLFDEVSVECEHLSANDALSKLDGLFSAKGINDFQAGGVLAVIHSNSYWKEYYDTSGKPFTSFKDFLMDSYAMKYRKATYYIDIYTSLVNCAVKYNDVKDIGWSKLKEIARVMVNETADEWIQRARDMSVVQLIAFIVNWKAVFFPISDADMTEVKTTTAMNFKVYPDQKETIRIALDKAKSEAGTEFDAVALEAICLNYISGEVVKQQPSMKKQFEKMGIMEVIQLIDAIWPNIDVSITLPEQENMKPAAAGVEMVIETVEEMKL